MVAFSLSACFSPEATGVTITAGEGVPVTEEVVDLGAEVSFVAF